MVAAAVVASAAVGAAASSAASSKQAKAANQASAAASSQAEKDRAAQEALYQQQRADQTPYREAGYRTLSQIMNGVTPGGEFDRRFSLADFQNDPGYQFRQQEGEAALRRAAAASGNAYSGAQLKALSRFNSGLASQEYGDAYNRFNTDQSQRFNRLASVAGIGQTALGQTQQAGTSAYGNIASIGANGVAASNRAMQDAAEARASGYVGAANAFGSGIRNLYNNGGASQNNSWLTPSSGGYSDLNTNATNQTSNFDLYGPGYSP